jgi:hypothetical protein
LHPRPRAPLPLIRVYHHALTPVCAAIQQHLA